MATKTKAKAKKPKKAEKPVKKELQPPDKVGRRRSTNATLLVQRTIRCNGHIHKIGLTSKGQLWFPDHSKEELEKFILMGDLGNNPCKCAVVLDAWRTDRMTDTQLHPEFRRERMTRSRLARRLQAHLNKHRNWPDIDVKYGTLVEPYEEEINNTGYTYTAKFDKVTLWAKFITETVYKTLIHRGWRKDMFDYDPGDTMIQFKDPGPQGNHSYGFAQILNLHHSYNGNYVTPYIGGEIMGDSTIHDDIKPEDVPWRMLIDAVESKLIYHILNKAQAEQLARREKEFEEIANNRIAGLGELPKHYGIGVQKDKGTVTVTIEHPGLTLQAANRIINQYRNDQSKVVQILKHNTKMRGRWFRTPGKPSRGFGSLVRKEKTNDLLAARPVEDESNVPRVA